MEEEEEKKQLKGINFENEKKNVAKNDNSNQ